MRKIYDRIGVSEYGRTPKDRSLLEEKIKCSEDDVQIAVLEWSKYNPVLRDHLISIANQRQTNVIHGAKLKRMGVRAGVSDLFLPYPIDKYHGLWIELKVGEKKLSKAKKEQVEWLNKMRKAGYAAFITFGFEETIYLLDCYLRSPEALPKNDLLMI